MRTILYISIILLFVNCQTQENETTQVNIPTNSLNGTWVMTQYFDTIMANKSIAKYRTQDATWFSILIDIQQDTIITYGSMFDQCIKADFTKDTIAEIMGWTSQDYWWFIQTDSLINLVQQPNQEYPDSTIYTFKRDSSFSNYCRRTRNEFRQKPFQRESIRNEVIDYFNDKFFNGKYRNIQTEEVVIFDGKGNVSGLKDSEKYETNVYFGTSHPFKNRDVIYFDRRNFYNWIFEEDKLILTKFERETEYADDYELTDEVIILEQID